MQNFDWDGFKSIEDTLVDLLGPEDPVLLRFDILPLDSKIEDILSPQIFLTRDKLLLLVDNKIEIYNLREIRVNILGTAPKFNLLQQYLEYYPIVKSDQTPLAKNIDVPDEWLRFSITEGNTLPKEFVMRRGNYPAKEYQTWACAQLIMNAQQNREDYQLRNMAHGNFSFFEGSVLIVAFLIFIAYILISILLGGILPDFLKMFLDSIFALVSIVVLAWMIWTTYNNVDRYHKIYMKYRSNSTKSGS